MNGWNGRRCRCYLTVSAAALSTLVLITPAGGEVNVERLDGAGVTKLIVHAGDGSVTRGTVATDPLGAAVVYRAEPTGYVSGCWGHTCAFGFADELRFGNFPPGGGELSSFGFSYAAGYGVLFNYCDPDYPAGDDCDCYCPTGAEGCGEGDPPYTVDAGLYDGPPGLCGGGLPILGTEVQFQSSASRPLGDRRIDVRVDLEPKVFVPGIVWGVVTFDIEDAWLAIGSAPAIGSSTLDGSMWIDSDSDGCWDDWECWPDPYGWTCPGCTGWSVWDAQASAQVVMKWQPVLPPASSSHSGTATYSVQGNEAVLAKGGEPVWMEIRVTDFDPKQTGVLLKAWQAGLDSSGYTTGLQGTLTPYIGPGPCHDHSDCSVVGPASWCITPDACEDLYPGVSCSDCEYFGYPCRCTPAFTDRDRADFIFYGQMILGGVDTSMPNYRWASTMMTGPIPSPGQESYLGSLVLFVPPEARGTFAVGFLPPPDCGLINGDDQFIPLLGFVPGRITVEVGRCCHDLLNQPGGCEDGLTANECAAKPGPVRFFPGETCESACPPSGACCDGTTGDCQENLLESECTDDPQSRWVKAALCQDLVPPCEEHTGACCVEGVCTDNVPQSACASHKWFKHTPCSDPEVTDVCLRQWAVPAVSEWGVAVIALLVATLAKVYFSRRRTVA